MRRGVLRAPQDLLRRRAVHQLRRRPVQRQRLLPAAQLRPLDLNALVRKSAIRAILRRPVGGLMVELQSGARIAAGRVYAKQLRAEVQAAS